MREIKFRIWDNISKDYAPMDCVLGFIVNKNNNILELKNNIENFDFTVEQFTGLTDKNGKEIYEGDIVKARNHYPENYTIAFIEGGYCLTRDDLEGFPLDINMMYPSYGCQIEVIGNMHKDGKSGRV